VRKENPLLQDKQLLRLLANVNDGVFSIDCDALIKEIDGLHLTRKVRYLKINHILDRTGLAKKTLISAVTQNQAFRSRILEIRELAWIKRRKLEETTEAVRNHLNEKYPQWLKSTYGNQTAIAAALSNALVLADTLHYRLSGVEEHADRVIEDIDKAHWSLQLDTQVLAIGSVPERSI
jgi:hypothetical protein